MMFLVLIKYEDDETTWGVADGPFKTERIARAMAREMAKYHPNTFAIVESKGLIRCATIEVLEES